MKNYLQMLKNIKAATSCTAITAKNPFYSFYSTPERHFSKNNLEDLLREVGASIVHENGSQALRFEPYLAGPKVDPGRWRQALELEQLFFTTNMKR